MFFRYITVGAASIPLHVRQPGVRPCSYTDDRQFELGTRFQCIIVQQFTKVRSNAHWYRCITTDSCRSRAETQRIPPKECKSTDAVHVLSMNDALWYMQYANLQTWKCFIHENERDHSTDQKQHGPSENSSRCRWSNFWTIKRNEAQTARKEKTRRLDPWRFNTFSHTSQILPLIIYKKRRCLRIGRRVGVWIWQQLLDGLKHWSQSVRRHPVFLQNV